MQITGKSGTYGRLNTVEIPVASIPALLVMKGYALSGRDKMKDVYDIVANQRTMPIFQEERTTNRGRTTVTDRLVE